MWKWTKNIKFKIWQLTNFQIQFSSKFSNFHNYFPLDNLFLSNLRIVNCTQIFFFLIWFTWKLYTYKIYILIYLYFSHIFVHNSRIKENGIRISTNSEINDLRWKQGSKFHSWIDPNGGSILWNSTKRNASSVYALASGHADCVAKLALPKNGITGERQRTMEARFLVAEETKKKKGKRHTKAAPRSLRPRHTWETYNNSFIDSKIPRIFTNGYNKYFLSTCYLLFVLRARIDREEIYTERIIMYCNIQWKILR